jgi:hypothetical protein
VAGGWYTDTHDSQQAMVVTETAGHCKRALELALPGNANPVQVTPPANSAAKPEFSLGDIVCTARGYCVATGSYLDHSHTYEPMVVVAVGHFNPGHGGSTAMAELESAGSWSKATTIQPPRNTEPKGNTEALAVACTRSGYCLAVGQYSTNITNETAMTAASR